MTLSLEAKVLADKALRDATNMALDTHLADVKLGLEERSLGTRVVDEIGAKAKAAFNETAEIAQENPGVIAGTIIALALWMLRNPIIRWLDERLGHNN